MVLGDLVGVVGVDGSQSVVKQSKLVVGEVVVDSGID